MNIISNFQTFQTTLPLGVEFQYTVTSSYVHIYVSPPVWYVHILTQSWVDPLLFRGARRELTQGDLYAHPQEMDSEELLNKFNKWGRIGLIIYFHR